jgi:hypothetical protein
VRENGSLGVVAINQTHISILGRHKREMSRKEVLLLILRFPEEPYLPVSKSQVSKAIGTAIIDLLWSHLDHLSVGGGAT